MKLDRNISRYYVTESSVLSMVVQEPLRILTGRSALEQLSACSFQDAWDVLASECPWATVFQSHRFASIWYSAYFDQYEPILMLEGNLTGLLALAMDRSSGELVTCGYPQAEYAAWITRPGMDQPFMVSVVRALRRNFPRKGLKFLYLPPGTPVSYFGRAEFSKSYVVPHLRAIRELSVEEANESLRKKSNKSRVNRIARIGPVKFAELRSRAELEPFMDRIAAFCDLRQGAVNAALPFLSDPHKTEFFLRVVEAGLGHASVLTAGNDLAAYHIGFRSRDEVAMGLIGHSPYLAEHSPGKLLLLYLARDLAMKGIARFDLTPGGEYKERFQNSHDTVHELTLFSSATETRRYQVKRWFRARAKRVLSRITDPSAIEVRVQKLSRLARPSIFPKAVRVIRRRLYSAESMHFYVRDSMEPSLRDFGPQKEFLVNRLEDLLLYEPCGAGRTRQEFLADCVIRLSAGEKVFTLTESGRLLHFAWLAQRSGEVPSGMGNTLKFPEDTWVLWDDWTHPAARGAGIHKASIRVRVEHALRAGAKAVIINVYAQNTASRRNIERIGFHYFGRMVRRFHLGSLEIRWEPNLDATGLAATLAQQAVA